jgi:hypothetical protein
MCHRPDHHWENIEIPSLPDIDPDGEINIETQGA